MQMYKITENGLTSLAVPESMPRRVVYFSGVFDGASCQLSFTPPGAPAPVPLTSAVTEVGLKHVIPGLGVDIELHVTNAGASTDIQVTITPSS